MKNPFAGPGGEMSQILPLEIHGEQHGVRIFEGCGPGPCIELLTEDDGFWHDTGVVFDAVWLTGLIQVLGRARTLLDGERATADQGE